MVNSYLQAQKNKYRITLELDVMSDFNPHQIDWNKLFELEPSESVQSYVEDLSIRW
jgi:predicted component of type VI protein secretion system